MAKGAMPSMGKAPMKGKKNTTQKVTPSGSPTNTVPGGPGKSFAQKGIAGPGKK